MEKFTMKRPVKADYIRKYGFEGERIWRFELLKYEEAKQAFDRRQANLKDYQDKIKNKEKASRELVKKVKTEKPKSAPKKSFEEFKQARERLGLKSTKKDYQDYLVRIGAKPTATPAPKKTTAKPKATAKKTEKPAPKKSTAKAKTKTATKRK